MDTFQIFILQKVAESINMFPTVSVLTVVIKKKKYHCVLVSLFSVCCFDSCKGFQALNQGKDYVPMVSMFEILDNSFTNFYMQTSRPKSSWKDDCV